MHAKAAIRLRSQSIRILLLLVALAIAAYALNYFVPARPHAAQAAGNALTGYAWSSDAGWIHFNGSNYGVLQDATTGNLSGYAWSSNLGWISFNSADVAGCPGPDACQPNVNPSNGNVTGWALACGPFANKNACSGVYETNSGGGNNTGGWTGWIHLSGTAQSGQAYGAMENSDCSITGYSWGEADFGWIHWAANVNGISYGVQGPAGCAPSTLGASIDANPILVEQGSTTQATWICNNAVDAQFQQGTGSTVDVGNNPTPARLSGVRTVTPVYPVTRYTIYCYGVGSPQPIQSAGVNVNVHSNNPPPIISITANPVTVQPGAHSTLTWSVTNVVANSCNITEDSAAWQNAVNGGTSGTGNVDTPNLSTHSTFTLTCTGTDSSTQSASVTVGMVPTFREQ